MKYNVLYVVLNLKGVPELFPAEGYRYNPETGSHELLIRVSSQELWVDTRSVMLKKIAGSSFCWNEYERGEYVELNQANAVCPECGWWRCHVCNSCRCNKPEKAGKKR